MSFRQQTEHVEGMQDCSGAAHTADEVHLVGARAKRAVLADLAPACMSPFSYTRQHMAAAHHNWTGPGCKDGHVLLGTVCSCHQQRP